MSISKNIRFWWKIKNEKKNLGERVTYIWVPTANWSQRQCLKINSPYCLWYQINRQDLYNATTKLQKKKKSNQNHDCVKKLMKLKKIRHKIKREPEDIYRLMRVSSLRTKRVRIPCAWLVELMIHHSLYQGDLRIIWCWKRTEREREERGGIALKKLISLKQ